MLNPFEFMILKLQQLGFFTFLLPFILMSAVLYGLLRKSQIFGPPEKNLVINAIIAIVASFMILAAPVITGINIEQQLAKFFLQSMIAVIMLIFAVLIVGVFFGPDLPGKIQEKLGAKYLGGLLVAGILIGLTLIVTSGLTNVFFPEGFNGLINVSEDVVISIATIVVLLIIVGVIVIFVSKEEKKK
ncbi:MAG: hypothetical protein QW423_01255 [Candidatus Aenigmatarchaeota archaeon]